MNRPESKEERSLSRARASSRNPRRLDSIGEKSSVFGHHNSSLLEKPQVTWTEALKETANITGRNQDDVLGGNFQSVKLGSMGKFCDFDVDNESGEYYNPHPDEFSAGDKIYEEEGEVNSSTNKEESVKDSIFRHSTNSFSKDGNVKQAGQKAQNRNTSKHKNLGNSANYGTNITHDFYNTNGFRKKRPNKEAEAYFIGKGDDICNEINSRVQNAMRRIEKKYRHKNNLNSQENKLIEKYREREKVNSHHIHEEKKNKSKNENYFSKTQNLGFSGSSNKAKNIDFSDLMSDYNHNGHAYQDKMNKDAETRQTKLNTDMVNIRDKITDQKKANDSQLRETFYNCLENKIKEKQTGNSVVGLGNSEIKYDNLNLSNKYFSGIENNFNENNVLNTSNAFNRTINKSQFRNTITGSNILSPINEGQQPCSLRFVENSTHGKMCDDLIKIDENRNYETTRAWHNSTKYMNSSSQHSNAHHNFSNLTSGNNMQEEM